MLPKEWSFIVDFKGVILNLFLCNSQECFKTSPFYEQVFESVTHILRQTFLRLDKFKTMAQSY